LGSTVTKSDGFESADDDSAAKHALRLVEDHDVELWCGNRLVAKPAIKKVGFVSAPLRLPNRDVYFAGHRRHKSLTIIAFGTFESPGIETWAFRFDDPQRHHCSAFGTPRTLNPVCEHFLVPFGCAYSTTFSRLVERANHWNGFAQIVCLESDRWLRSDHDRESFPVAAA
jgi:hypothetical protein